MRQEQSVQPTGGSEREELRGSHALWDRALGVIAGGVTSAARRTVLPHPIYFERGSGPYLWDVDGNRYIDFTLAYGPAILGHTPATIREALHGQVDRGFSFGSQHRYEVEVAELLTSLIPNAEQVILAINGTQAVEAAVRAARAYTGRPKVVKIEGGYHGSTDGLYVSTEYDPARSGDAWRPKAVPQSEGMSPGAVSDVLVAPWNDLESMGSLFGEHGSTIAALLIDPIQANAGLIPPLPGYLQNVRNLTRKHGIVLILDEVISGFRLDLRGAQGYFGIDADLAVFGKAIAGGVAMSAVTGSRAVLEPVASFRAHHLGTFNGNPLACVAAIATMKYLESNQSAIYGRFHELGERLAVGLRGISAALAIRSLGPILTVSVNEPTKHVVSARDRYERDVHGYLRLAEQLLYRGVLVMPLNGLWYLSTTHTELEVDMAIQAAGEAFEAMAAGGGPSNGASDASIAG